MLQIDLHGHIAVITGASGMLGRVMARNFAHCGADLALHYFHGEEQANRLAEELRAETGRRIITVGADITKSEDVRRMHEQVKAQLGVADILVHIFLPDERKYYNMERLWMDDPEHAILYSRKMEEELN